MCINQNSLHFRRREEHNLSICEMRFHPYSSVSFIKVGEHTHTSTNMYATLLPQGLPSWSPITPWNTMLNPIAMRYLGQSKWNIKPLPLLGGTRQWSVWREREGGKKKYSHNESKSLPKERDRFLNKRKNGTIPAVHPDRTHQGKPTSPLWVYLYSSFLYSFFSPFFIFGRYCKYTWQRSNVSHSSVFTFCLLRKWTSTEKSSSASLFLNTYREWSKSFEVEINLL